MVADGDMTWVKSKPATAVIYALGWVYYVRYGGEWNLVASTLEYVYETQVFLTSKGQSMKQRGFQKGDDLG